MRNIPPALVLASSLWLGAFGCSSKPAAPPDARDGHDPPSSQVTSALEVTSPARSRQGHESQVAQIPQIAAPTGDAVTRVCDLKRPLAGVDATPPLSLASYAPVLTAMKRKLGCSVVRLYIDPAITDPTAYPQLYRDAAHYARSMLGLKIYANPLGTGKFGLGNAAYAAWIVAYANAVKPEYLGPFNESGLKAADLVDIAARVRAGLSYSAILVGPDAQRVAGTTALFAADPQLSSSFDVLGSHNADGDDGATAAGWAALAAGAKAKGKPLWSSENPRPLHAASATGDDVGVAAAVSGNADAIVFYEAFPTCVTVDGTLTEKGTALVNGLPPSN